MITGHELTSVCGITSAGSFSSVSSMSPYAGSCAYVCVCGGGGGCVPACVRACMCVTHRSVASS